jgi:putative transposase
MSLNPAPPAQVDSTPTTGCDCGCFRRPRRYLTDTTDTQWAILADLLPTPASQQPTGGHPERHHRRAIIDAIFYLVDNGIKWRAMPTDFPPWRTVYGYFIRWSDTLATLNLVHTLRERLRVALGRNPTPTAGCIDAQSVPKSADATVETTTSGFDPHKRVNGRKRHVLVDTFGHLIDVHATPANTHDRDAATHLLHTAATHGITHIWADSAYRGTLVTTAKDTYNITIDIAPTPTSHGFTVVPRRWVVERSLAWYSRRRRCARDYERLPDHHETMVCWAAIIQMIRRYAPIAPQHTKPQQVQKQAL